jgi:hypothetical protein
MLPRCQSRHHWHDHRGPLEQPIAPHGSREDDEGGHCQPVEARREARWPTRRGDLGAVPRYRSPQGRCRGRARASGRSAIAPRRAADGWPVGRRPRQGARADPTGARRSCNVGHAVRRSPFQQTVGGGLVHGGDNLTLRPTPANGCRRESSRTRLPSFHDGRLSPPPQCRHHPPPIAIVLVIVRPRRDAQPRSLPRPRIELSRW